MTGITVIHSPASAGTNPNNLSMNHTNTTAEVTAVTCLSAWVLVLLCVHVLCVFAAITTWRIMWRATSAIDSHATIVCVTVL